MDLRKEIIKIQNDFPYFKGTDYVDALVELCENYHGELVMAEYLDKSPNDADVSFKNIENFKF